MLNRCPECFERQQKIDRLTEEVGRLKQQLRHRTRTAEEGFFGSSTPSSKLPVKANTEARASSRKRGAQPGHCPHHRQAANEETADRVVDVPSDFNGICPDCGGRLESRGTVGRLVLESRPVAAERIVLRLPVERCCSCRRTLHTRAPSVLPKTLLGNQLAATAVEMHYLHGVPLGRVSEQLGVNAGCLVALYHRLAHLFSDVPKTLTTEYRRAAVRHADETGWRTNGKNGYAWLFATTDLSIFQFEATRSSQIPKAVFGAGRLPGVLVVDRYSGYNKMPCKIQYCYAHLLREVQDAEKEFPDSIEVRAFVGTVAPLIASAIGLRSHSIARATFKKKAREVQQALKAAMAAPAQHAAIRRIQDIFTDNEERLYHWARDPAIPADNNLAERDLRPTVIARKTSFGSQSGEGARTRGVLMTVLHTLRKRGIRPGVGIKLALDALAVDQAQPAYPLLFPKSEIRGPISPRRG